VIETAQCVVAANGCADRVRFLGDREADEAGKAAGEVGTEVGKEEGAGDEIPF